jgi:hypothetical protein
MKRTLLLKPALAIAGLSLLATGCVVRERVYQPPPPPPGAVEPAPTGAEVEVSGEPPAPVVESVTVEPAPGFLWIGGAWFWEGGGWVWHAGHWDRPPRPGAVWIRPHYVFRGGRHVWVRGYWR